LEWLKSYNVWYFHTATGLERFEIEKIKSFFVKFDLLEKGFIMKYEVDDVLKSKLLNSKRKRNSNMDSDISSLFWMVYLWNRHGLHCKRWWIEEIYQCWDNR